MSSTQPFIPSGTSLSTRHITTPRHSDRPNPQIGSLVLKFGGAGALLGACVGLLVSQFSTNQHSFQERSTSIGVGSGLGFVLGSALAFGVSRLCRRKLASSIATSAGTDYSEMSATSNV